MFNHRFYASGGQVDIKGGLVRDEGPIGGSATASITFNTTGTEVGVGSESSINDTWFSAPFTGVGNQYQIRVSALGSPSGPALNTWWPLSSARTWSVTRSNVGGTTSATLTVEIGDLSGNVLDTANIQLEAFLS